MSKARCSRCGKVFGSPKSVQEHIDRVHNGVGEVKPPRQREPRDSLAETMIEGLVNRETGETNPEWLDDVIDTFAGKRGTK